MACPEPGCGGQLRRRFSPRFERHFYGCTEYNRTGCTGSIGAHRDGRPLGIPADGPTKEWRKKAHAALDPLWKEGHVSRGKAYRWLAKKLRVTGEVHIGEMGINDCRRAIAVVELFGYELRKEGNDVGNAAE